MNTTTLRSSYPIFTPNQVLTDADLNRVVEYLDEQNRLTRTHFIGMGVLSGMEVEAKIIQELLPSQQVIQKSQISISAGCGITSEGYVISVPETILTFYKNAQSVAATLFTSGQQVGRNAQASNYKVTELFEQPADDQSSNGVLLPSDERLLKDLLSNQILVVVCEIEEQQDDSCWLNYDEQSKIRNFRLRFFLLPSKSSSVDPSVLSAEKLLRIGYQMDQLPAAWKTFDTQYGTQAVFDARNHFFEKFDIQVPRFGYSDADKSVDLIRINDYKAFRENYNLICSKAIAAISEAFPKLFQLFSPFFTSFHPETNKDFGQLELNLTTILNNIKLEKTMGKEAPYALQYFYDYLNQLVAAYYELAAAAFDLMDDSNPDTQRFPRFLMLGQLSLKQPIEKYALPSAYRSHFVQPPIYNNNSLRAQQVRYLYDRLLLLCKPDSFYMLPFKDTPLRITPSKDRSAPLSEQAIPYYLNYPKLYDAWNYDAHRKGRSEQQPAYFLPKQGNPDSSGSRDDLSYRLDAYNFYRIEGHIGKDKGLVLERILDYRQRYNLAFDIVILKLGALVDFNDLNIFGQLDALNADFRGVKDIFQKIWNRYQEDWSKNVFLCTLKQVFFDQPDLSYITSDQLYNPILAAVRSTPNGDACEFEAETNASHQPTGKYRLFIRNAEQTRLAHFTFGNEQGTDPFTDLLDLSGLSAEQIIQEQKQISIALSTSLGAGRFTYGVECKPPNTFNYYLCLSISDKLNLPINPTAGQIQKVVSIKLISENYFTVSRENPNKIPLINQREFQDFETLYGLLRDIPDDANQNMIDYELGNHSVAVDYINAFDLKGRIEAYQQQVEQMKALHLFNKFALYHPGMEHLGGVPKGGTFILVYVDGRDLVRSLLVADRSFEYQARKDQIKEFLLPAAPQEVEDSQDFLNWENIVVADYSLPYRCWSDTINNSYKLIRLRPIVLLEKNSFCADDSTRYEFLLNPLNGNLKGEGTFFEVGRYYFQPSQIRQAMTTDSAITFTYVVEGRYNTLVVMINPLPNAGFQIGDDANKTSFCINDSPLNLVPKYANGSFHALDAGQDISTVVLDTQVQPPQFKPSAVNLSGAAQKVITLKYEVTSEHGCKNQSQQDIAVHALPDASFRMGDGNTTGFCVDIASVQLTPNQPNGVFRALDGNRDISTRVLQGDRFLPSAVDLSGAPQKTITVRYSVTSDHGCTHQTEQQIMIFALPDADFRVGSVPEQATFCVDSAPVPLTPNQSGGTFQAMVGTRDISREVLNLQTNPPQFLPQQVQLGSAKRMRVTLIYQISSPQNCANQSKQKVMVVALPDASFQLGESDKTVFCADAAAIALKPQEPGGTFSAFDGAQDVSSQVIQGDQFVPSALELGGAAEKVITLKYDITSEHGCTKQSQRDITIHKLPDVDFRIGDGTKTSFCANERIVFTPHPPNGTYQVLDGQQDITDRVIRGDRLISRALDLGKADQKTLTVRYSVTSDQGCSNRAEQQITIFALPDADFQVGTAPEQTTFYEDSDPIPLTANQTGGTFQAFVKGQDISAKVLNLASAPPEFKPSAVNLDGAEQVEVTIKYVVTNSNGCTAHSTHILTVHRVPVAPAQSLNLLTISPDGDTTASVSVNNGHIFKLSEFSSSNQYRFEALMGSGTVGSVIFTYTAPNGNKRKRKNLPVNAAPYLMPDAWSPIVGKHQIKVQPFSKADGGGMEGSALAIAFTIENDSPLPVNPEPNLGNSVTTPDDSPTNPAPSTDPTNPNLVNPVSLPNSSPIATFQRGNLMSTSLPQASDRPPQPFTFVAETLPRAQASFAQLVLAAPRAAISPQFDANLSRFSGQRGNASRISKQSLSNVKSPPLVQANPSQSSENLLMTATSLKEQLHSPQRFDPHFSNRSRSKLTWALVLSTLVALSVLGWVYSLLKQPRNPVHTNSLENIQSSPQ